MAAIDYNDVDTLSFPFSVALGYSYNGYPRLFRARMEGCRGLTRPRHERHAHLSRALRTALVQLTLGPSTRSSERPHQYKQTFRFSPGLCAKWGGVLKCERTERADLQIRDAIKWLTVA